MYKTNKTRALAVALLALVALSVAALRAAAPDATNHMAGWDGNGIGTTTDKPDAFGWTCSDATRTWKTVQTGADYSDFYRDNLWKGDAAARVIMHGNTDAAYSFPVSDLKAGKTYKFHCGFSNMNSGAVTHHFSIASEQFGAGTVCGSFEKKSAKWSSTSTAEFFFEVPTDGTYYFCWTTTNSQDRALAWGFTVTEATDVYRVTFVTGDGATAIEAQQHEGSYTVTRPTDPVKEGYDFAGWYTDEALTQPYDFATTQTADLTLYAKFTATVAVTNYMQGWDGNGRGTTTDTPDAFGWQSTDASLTWSDASSATGTYSNYYRDNLKVDGVETRVVSHTQNDAVFSFPVKGLESGKYYKFHPCNTNMNASVSTTFAIGTKRDGTGDTYGAVTRPAPTWGSGKYINSEFLFRVPADAPAEVYMTWQTNGGHDRNIAWGFSIVEVTGVHAVTFHSDGSHVADQLFQTDTYTVTQPAEPTKEGCDFAGWYADAAFTTAFDFTKPVTADTDVYARFLASDYTGPLTPLNITTDTTLPCVAATAITVADGVALHLTDARALRCGSTVSLEGEGSTLYLDGTYGEDFAALVEPRLTVSGRAFDATKDRVAAYRNGCVVMPGDLTHTPVTAYTEENCKGTSLDCQQDVFYRLNAEEYSATYDNKIRSLHIRKGYMACLANNPDGTGFSKVFIANDGDLDVNTLPAALQFASFIRVARWDWPGKRGKANNPAGLTRSSWYYNWSAGKDNSYRVAEFVPIHQGLYWPSWTEIGNLKGVSHVLGLNEPDHTDQANATVAQAIEQWYHMAESGLRIGSPAPDCLNKQWLKDFIKLADELNYRVDFTAAHMYWSGQSGSSIVGSINAQSNATGGRPVWITEWNNGANWTSENWPTNEGEKRDADFNIIYDAAGNTTTVKRPHTTDNSAKQVAWLKDVLPALDNCDKLERHAFYDWVQDARAIVLDNKLTPAGEYFAAYSSKPAYSTASAYDHKWHIAPPYVVASTVADDNYKKVHVRFYDHNGETGVNYIVERQADDGDWEVIDTLTAGTDYQYGDKAVAVVDSFVCNTKQAYRIKATAIESLGGAVSQYSRTASITRDAPTTPTLTAEIVSATKAKVTWTKPTGARAFKLERATVVNGECGEYATLAEGLTATTYSDESLTPATTYRYRLTTLSSAATDPVVTADVTLPALTVPATPTGLRASNGDHCVALTWAFAYDAKYNIWRSAAADGTFTQIAADIDATRYADTTAVNGNTYYYKVEAANTVGTSAPTNAVAGKAVAGQRAHIAFNEGEGTEAFDDWGGYTATLYGTPWVDGPKTGDKGVLTSKSTKHYVQLGDGIMQGLTDFTISTWTSCSKYWGRLFDFGTGTNNFMILIMKAGTMRYKITTPEHGTFDHTFNCVNGLNVWKHIVLTQHGDTLSLYIDGALTGEVTGVTTTPADLGLTTKNYLARSQYPQDAYPDFAYSDFRVYTRSLTATEVQSLYEGNEIATGITTVASVTRHDDCVYDLTGRRVTSAARPGIYIVGGRKVVVK